MQVTFHNGLQSDLGSGKECCLATQGWQGSSQPCGCEAYLRTTACATHGHLCVATSTFHQGWLTHVHGVVCDQVAHCPVRWTAKRVTGRSCLPVATRATWVMTCPCCTAPPSTSTMTASTTCEQQHTPHALSSGYRVVQIQGLLGVCFSWHGPRAALAQHHQLAWYRLHASCIQTAGSLMQTRRLCTRVLLQQILSTRSWFAKCSHQEHPPDYSWAHAPPQLPLQPPEKGAAQGCELHSLCSHQPAPARPPAAALRQRDSGCMGSRTAAAVREELLLGYAHSAQASGHADGVTA